MVNYTTGYPLSSTQYFSQPISSPTITGYGLDAQNLQQNARGYSPFDFLSPTQLNDAYTNQYFTSGQFNPASNFVYPNQQNQQGVPPLTLETVFPQSSISNSPLYTTQGAFNAIGDINDINLRTLGIAQQSAVQQAQSAYLDALLEAQAQQKILQMNNQSTQANSILDQQTLALKINYGILSKQTEQYVLDAELREKFTNLFFNLEKSILDNTFQRAKTIVSSAKY
jgi:hypothetical protein